MELTTVWFALIAVLWMGYFCLEGFDFGVGMLLPVLARDNTERRVLINTIGPVWDGNEVWVLVAGGATFAAFPEWYATLFSGFYLPLLLILVALIVRGLAFEYRAKRDDETWRQRWDLVLIVGSFVPSLLWGVAFANILRGVKLDAGHEYVGGFFELLNPYALLGGVTTLLLFLTHGAVFVSLKTDGDIRHRARDLALKLGLGAAVAAVAFLAWTQAGTGTVASAVAFANILRGVKLDADHEYVGGFFELLNPYALLGGVTTLLLFLTHGAVFVSLKTDGDIRHRARDLALKLGLGAAVAAVAFLVWTQAGTGTVASAVAFVVAALALVAGLVAVRAGREGWGFLGTFVAIGVAVAGLFLALFPDVMPTTLAGGSGLTTTNAAATAYTLKIMTVVALVFTPVVLAYQGWTYWVFRKRIAVHHIPQPAPAPVGTVGPAGP